jgi:hypothetical protein
LLWTGHLHGLEAILTQLDLHKPATPRNDLKQHLLEACALLDLPGFTIGRRNPSRQLWSRFVLPLRRTGIEPVTGLPRSLLDILSCIDSPGTRHALLSWTPAKADHVIQYHMWEVFRLAGLLLNGCLRLSSEDGIGSDVQDKSGENENLTMRLYSNIQSLKNVPYDPFRNPLRRCILYPLWIAALLTDDGSVIRQLFFDEFKSFVSDRGYPVDHAAWSVLLEAWSIRRQEPGLSPLIVADNVASEKEIELHLF